MVNPVFVEEESEIVVITGHALYDWARSMKISYDEECDASITSKDTTVTSQRVAEGVALEFDAEGHLAGIEILDAVQRFGTGETLQRVLLENVGSRR